MSIIYNPLFCDLEGSSVLVAGAAMQRRVKYGCHLHCALLQDSIVLVLALTKALLAVLLPSTHLVQAMAPSTVVGKYLLVVQCYQATTVASK